jgi:hypothetical protein
MHFADLEQSIISTHREFGNSTDYQMIYRKILDTTIDAAETIVQCSKHMKTIVDGEYIVHTVHVVELPSANII